MLGVALTQWNFVKTHAHTLWGTGAVEESVKLTAISAYKYENCWSN
jgi:hypothetical protein